MFAAPIQCSADARRLARRCLPRMIFDYIDGAPGLSAGLSPGRPARVAAVRRKTGISCADRVVRDGGRSRPTPPDHKATQSAK
jgi:hypothetical protein